MVQQAQQNPHFKALIDGELPALCTNNDTIANKNGYFKINYLKWKMSTQLRTILRKVFFLFKKKEQSFIKEER